MSIKSAIVSGVALGLLYVITLWAAYDAFSYASFLAYGNRHIIPLLVVDVIMALSFSLLWAYEIMETMAQYLIDEYVLSLATMEDDFD